MDSAHLSIRPKEVVSDIPLLAKRWLTPDQSREEIKAIALYIGKKNYLPDVNKHIQSLTDKLPLVFVATGDFNHSDEAMKLVRDIVALLQRLKDQNGLTAIRFYCGLPFNVIPLLSANLLHVIDNVEFMEYRRDLKSGNPPAQDTYIHLPMSSQLD